MPESLSLSFANNAPWKATFQMMQGGVAVSLVGCSLRMQLRLLPSSDEIALDLSTVNGRLVIVDAENGIWSINVSVLDSSQVLANSYALDMIVTPSVGDPFRPYSGDVTVIQGVTREGRDWY